MLYFLVFYLAFSLILYMVLFLIIEIRLKLCEAHDIQNLMRSGEAHYDQELAAIKNWQLRSGEAYCNQELENEVRRGRMEGRKKGGGGGEYYLSKYNNIHLPNKEL